jgi:hypothetical protein
VARHQKRSRTAGNRSKPKAGQPDGGRVQPPGPSQHARGSVRNLGRERVAQNAGQPERSEPDGRL